MLDDVRGGKNHDNQRDAETAQGDCGDEGFNCPPENCNSIMTYAGCGPPKFILCLVSQVNVDDEMDLRRASDGLMNGVEGL